MIWVGGSPPCREMGEWVVTTPVGVGHSSVSASSPRGVCRIGARGPLTATGTRPTGVVGTPTAPPEVGVSSREDVRGLERGSVISSDPLPTEWGFRSGVLSLRPHTVSRGSGTGEGCPILGSVSRGRGTGEGIQFSVFYPGGFSSRGVDLSRRRGVPDRRRVWVVRVSVRTVFFTSLQSESLTRSLSFHYRLFRSSGPSSDSCHRSGTGVGPSIFSISRESPGLGWVTWRKGVEGVGPSLPFRSVPTPPLFPLTLSRTKWVCRGSGPKEEETSPYVYSVALPEWLL